MNALPEAEMPKVTRMAAVGDLMLGRGVDTLLLGSSSGIEKVFGDFLPLLQSQDLTLGNLEGALTNRTLKTPKAYNFRFSPKILAPLMRAGFGYLAPANNHVFDYGEAGLIDTITALEEAAMPASGIGRNLSEAARPWRGRTGGLEVQILSLGAYPAEGGGFDGLRDAAARADRPGILWGGDDALSSMRGNFSPDTFDIVLAHGGFEWQNEPSRAQILLYRSFIDAGADLVLGSHPHVLQAAETYRGRLILYSLGNFIFPGMDETRYGEESLLLALGLYQGEVRYAEFHPARLDGRRVFRDKSGEVLKRFLLLCKEFRPPA
jgi:poly-gamma-glutamate synthesis protein (capsule biosynthesis protein)